MPELAEVDYFRKQWMSGSGRRVASVQLHAGKRVFRDCPVSSLRRGLQGTVLRELLAHGKQMAFVFDRRHWLGVHLGMTGALLSVDASALPGKHDHLRLCMEGGPTLVFRDPRLFGRIRYSHVPDTLPDWWAALPPGILSSAFTFEHFAAIVQRRAKAPIKAVLLMQAFFPGIGNWMADEILWQSRIYPGIQAGLIGPRKCRELYAAIRTVSAGALETIGVDWRDPPDSWLFRHRWQDGGCCPKTGKRLRREAVGGRTTCWSPAWQIYR